MNYIVDEKIIDKVLHPYFDFLLKDLYLIFEEKFGENCEGWKIPKEDNFIFLYKPDELELEKEDRTLYYWGTYFESAEGMFNLDWIQTKYSLSRYLRKKGFKFRRLA